MNNSGEVVSTEASNPDGAYSSERPGNPEGFIGSLTLSCWWEARSGGEGALCVLVERAQLGPDDAGDTDKHTHKPKPYDPNYNPTVRTLQSLQTL